MRKTKKPRSKTRVAILLIILAILCIGTSELIACYFFAPPLFHKITDPVRAAARTTIDTTIDLSERAITTLSSLWDQVSAELAERSERDTDTQEAGEPAIKNDAMILDPAITELTTEGSQAVLTGGVMPVAYFNQGDDTWSSQPYGSDNIGHYGCGPTVMAMAVCSFTDQETDPAQMAELAVQRGHWAKGSGSYLSIIEGLAKEYGISAKPIDSLTPEAIEEALLSGKMLIALMGPGHFTKIGHFILIRGITLDGSLLVADPNSEERSLKKWSPQLILDELSSSTAHGAPLWTLELSAS